MASIKTNKGREQLAKAVAGTIVLPKVTHLVLGSGGTDSGGNPKALTGAETTLFKEELRKAVTPTFPVTTTTRYSVSVGTELIGKTINEAGLIDANGDLIAIKTFLNKGIEAGTVINFTFDVKF